MTFTIDGQPYTFNLQLDQSNKLTGFTASTQSTTYVCSIQLASNEDVPEFVCCTPSGCTAGGCGPGSGN